MNATTIGLLSRIRKLSLSRARRLGIVAAFAAGFSLGTLLLPPFAQSAALHEIVDAGWLLGIANLWDALASPVQARQVCHGLRG